MTSLNNVALEKVAATNEADSAISQSSSPMPRPCTVSFVTLDQVR